jgi:hypothetical protein
VLVKTITRQTDLLDKIVDDDQFANWLPDLG